MDVIKIAKEVFDIEAATLLELKDKLNADFTTSLELILRLKGRLVVSGMGKSGHIGAKIAATLASTGTPSFFMHPAEAIHGDLGMLTQNDALLAISNSGETEEILKIIPAVKKRGIALIAMCGDTASTLAKQADFVLDISVSKEACPLQLAPMSSTTATLAMGDAMAAALMKLRGFQADDFALFHPGGSLGKKLLTRVCDVMVKRLPKVAPNTLFNEFVDVMTTGKLGLCLVMSGDELVGIITDGDLRRALSGANGDFSALTAAQIMSKSPKIIDENAMATEAEKLMLTHKIKELPVANADKKVVGIVQLYDIGRI